MGGQHHLIAVKQRIVRGDRLLIIYINAGASKMAGIEGLNQRRRIHNSPSGTVKQDGALFHHGKLTGTDESPALVGELNMKADHVCLFQQFIQLDKRYPEFPGTIGGWIIGPGNYLHTDGASQPGHFGADIARSDDAKHLSL